MQKKCDELHGNFSLALSIHAYFDHGFSCINYRQFSRVMLKAKSLPRDLSTVNVLIKEPRHVISNNVAF